MHMLIATIICNKSTVPIAYFSLFFKMSSYYHSAGCNVCMHVQLH